MVVGLLGFVAGCAHLEPGELIEGSLSRLERADATLYTVLESYCSPPSQWSLRVVNSYRETLPIQLVQSVSVSSLAYFPRIIPRLEKAFPATGIDLNGYYLSSSGGENACLLSLRITDDLSYVFELQQTVAGRLALIIDDCGNTLKNKELLLNLDYPLTVAILPALRYSSTWDELASSRGFEVILHLPLEPVSPRLHLGPGGIRCDTPREEMAGIIESNLRELPHAVGVNNHMGSAFTRNTEAMRFLLEEVKSHGLFFVDSLTITHPVTPIVAEECGIKYITRDIFLDHENTEEYIVRQLETLKDIARRRDFAIGIGHDRTLTLEVLSRKLPSLADEDLQIVPVSALVK